MKLVIRLHHADVIITRGGEDAARDFYCNLLGFTEIPKPKELLKNGGLWLTIGDIQIHLSIQDSYDPRQTKSHLAYEVSDLELMKERLKERSIEFKEGIPLPGLLRGDIRDPFGNRIEFLQVLR